MSLLNKASIVTTPTSYENGKILSVKPSTVLGSELVTNGDFATDSDWTKGTGWGISGGTANCDGTQTSNSLIYQSGVLANADNFKCEITISNYQSGVLRFVLGLSLIHI